MQEFQESARIPRGQEKRKTHHHRLVQDFEVLIQFGDELKLSFFDEVSCINNSM